MPCLAPDYPLIRAVMRMNDTKTRQMPVVQGIDQPRLVGLLSMTDIVRAQAIAAQDAAALDHTAAPRFAEERETLEG